MKMSWQAALGHLESRWSELLDRSSYDASWMPKAGDVHGSYLVPTPDFASHCPFGGFSWFQPAIELDSSAEMRRS